MPRHTRIALLVIAVLFTYATLWPQLSDARLPGINTGYAPEQPIAYSHRLHAGELQIDCQYCHTAATRGRHAGIPSGDTCMNCHAYVKASMGAIRAEEEDAKKAGRAPRALVSPELRKLYDAMGLDESLQRDPRKPIKPIRWVRVHRLPDHAAFNHSVHVKAGVDCQKCHGPVQTMERVRQHETLTMGWCVNCHRQVNNEGVKGREVKASNDCAACHY